MRSLDHDTSWGHSCRRYGEHTERDTAPGLGMMTVPETTERLLASSVPRIGTGGSKTCGGGVVSSGRVTGQKDGRTMTLSRAQSRREI